MKKSGNSSDRPGSGRPKASGGKKPTGKRSRNPQKPITS